MQAGRSFPLHVGTIRDQGWPDGTFDAVYAQDVLEHLSRPREELAEIARVLRPGGALYVHVPNYASLTIRCGVSRFAYNEPPGHLNFFTPTTLTAMLRQNGFDRVRLGSDHLEYADFWRREPIDYDAFESRIAAEGRREGGPLWSVLRAAMNIPLRRLLLGTYLWGYAVRQ
jgi:SAM-dependent methyltransferase